MSYTQHPQSSFNSLKDTFKNETGIDADKNFPLFIEYVKAKSLLNIFGTLDIISLTVQRIESKIKLVP